MRKTIAMLVVAAAAAGCAKKEEAPPPQVQNPVFQQEFANAPSWVLNAKSTGSVLVAVGSAKAQSPEMIQFAREEAMAAARDELARQMSVRVKNMVKRFMQTTGVGDAKTVDRVSATVSKQVTNQVLSGSHQTDLWISPSGVVWVRVELDPKMAREAVVQAMRTSMTKEALWQQFQAKKAFDELQAEIEQELQ
ncbi:MAG: hypothetical protein D6771_01735 [Zetaproteobacteria bacterium]|nr:MAG: hypothetical protein D6771_01735 [Zetaproteobacteria bacterium]